MANRNFIGKYMYTMHAFPVMIDCNVAIGATGAVGAMVGSTVTSVTRLSTGTYQVKLPDNYNLLYAMNTSIQSPVSGSPVTGGSFSIGTVYQIVTLGTTNWTAAGLPSGLTPAIGQVFLAATIGDGNGTAKVMSSSGIASIETLGATNTMLTSVAPATQASYITIRCYGATSSSVTTLIPTDPASGSVLYIKAMVSNSSVIVNGE